MMVSRSLFGTPEEVAKLSYQLGREGLLGFGMIVRKSMRKFVESSVENRHDASA